MLSLATTAGNGKIFRDPQFDYTPASTPGIGELKAPAPGLAPGSGSGHQLPLLNPQGTPDTPLKVAPDLLYHGPGQRWRCIDCFSDCSFAGSFTGVEIDYIAAHFRDWPRAIDPGHFERVPEQAITDCQAAALGVVV